MLSVSITILLVGFLLYLANAYVPMAPPIRNVLNAVVVIILIIWLLGVFGLLTYVDVPVRRVH